MATPTNKPKVEKVVTGKVKVKKKSEIHKLTDVFVAEDFSTVKEYALSELIVPTIKKLVFEIIRDGADMILFGGSRRNSDRRGTSDTISYRNYYDRGRDRREPDRFTSSSYRTKPRYSYNDISIPTRGEAEDVLTRMEEILDTYPEVTVADLYDLVGVTGNYTDQKYGWTNLRGAEVVRDRDGYYRLRLPKAIPLD